MLGDAEAVVDRTRSAPVAYRRAAARSSVAGTPVISSTASGLFCGTGDELGPLVEALAPLGDELARIGEALGDDHVRHRVHDATLVPGASCRWWAASMCGVRTRSMRRGSTTISCAPLAQAALHARGEHRVAVGGVGADHHDHVGLFDRAEVLGAGRRAERLLEAVAGRGEWHTRAQVSTLLLPNAARTIFWTTYTSSLVHRDEVIAPIEPGSVRGLDLAEPVGGVGDRLVPGHDAPLVVIDSRIIGVGARARRGWRSRTRTGP